MRKRIWSVRERPGCSMLVDSTGADSCMGILYDKVKPTRNPIELGPKNNIII